MSDAAGSAPGADIEEVVNYVDAMRWGAEGSKNCR